MSLTSFTTRTASTRLLLSTSVRKRRHDRCLTAQERANLAAHHPSPAIITASLGGSTAPR